MRGDAFEVRIELGPGVDRAGWVVRMADVDDLRPVRDRVEQRGEVVAMIPQRDLHGLGAELASVNCVAGKRRPAEDDLIARVEQGL